MRKLLDHYINGNYRVKLYDDGTKVRFNNGEPFVAKFPENIDIKITDYCDADCPFCHEASSVAGIHGNILSFEFLETLRPGTEIAIGGGNPLSHPDLEAFLVRMQDNGVICNLTVNAVHLTAQVMTQLELWMKNKMIYGLGISLNTYNEKVVEFAKTHENVVLHIISGIMGYEELKSIADSQIKILLLGYKNFRRGEEFFSSQIEKKMASVSEHLGEIMTGFHTVSFDNLAIEQLKPQDHMSKQEWQTFYMGDDGNFTMYIDMVKEQFARNSTAVDRYALLNDIDEMFKIVKEQSL